MADYTILIIDYEPPTLEVAQAVLEARGLRVEVAKDGRAGAKMFDKLEPTLTLVEVMLPKRSGLEVCQEIKASAGGPDAPVVVMSSRFRSRKFRHQAVHRYGADEYVEKPLDEPKLLGLIKRYVDRGQSPGAVAPPIERTPEPEPAPPPPPPEPEPVSEAAPRPKDPADGALDSEISDHLDSILGDL
jgi:DNA-binding response OmpR family regulator